MTPEQKMQLDKIRDELAITHCRFDIDQRIDRMSVSDWKRGFDRAIEHLAPALDAVIKCESDGYLTVSESKAIAKVFGENYKL